MEISCYIQSGCRIVRMAGELDLYSSSATCTNILRHLMDGIGGKVVVDLGEISYLDSSGIGVLLAAFSQARKSGIGLRFANPTAEVQRILRLTSLNGFLPVEETVLDAVKSLLFKGL